MKKPINYFDQSRLLQ